MKRGISRLLRSTTYIGSVLTEQEGEELYPTFFFARPVNGLGTQSPSSGLEHTGPTAGYRSMLRIFQSLCCRSASLRILCPNRLSTSCSSFLEQANSRTAAIPWKSVKWDCSPATVEESSVLCGSWMCRNNEAVVKRLVLERRSLPAFERWPGGNGLPSVSVCEGENGSLRGEMSVGSVLKKRRSKMNKHKYKKLARKNRFKTKR